MVHAHIHQSKVCMAISHHDQVNELQDSIIENGDHFDDSPAFTAHASQDNCQYTAEHYEPKDVGTHR